MCTISPSGGVLSEMPNFSVAWLICACATPGISTTNAMAIG